MRCDFVVRLFPKVVSFSMKYEMRSVGIAQKQRQTSNEQTAAAEDICADQKLTRQRTRGDERERESSDELTANVERGTADRPGVER